MRPLKLTLYFLLIAVLGAELIAAAFYQIHFKTLVSAPVAGREKFSKYWHNPNTRKCPEKELWAPLPHLGYGRALNLQECQDGKGMANNVGLPGHDFPDKKNPEAFTILLTGGSVAERFALKKIQDAYYFEKYLNERFLPPRGKEIRLLIGANSDFRQPQQAISIMLYHDVVDAVIDLSGYNENIFNTDRNRVEKTSELYWELFMQEKVTVLLARGRKIVSDLENGLCKYSFACVYYTEEKLRGVMREFKLQKDYNFQKRVQTYSDSLSLPEAARLRQEKLKGYYRIMDANCKASGLQCSYFLQPAPVIRKRMTAFEKAQIPDDSGPTWENYKTLTSSLMTLSREIPIHSLLGIYEKENETMYGDWIHLQDDPVKVTRSFEIMAKSLADQIQKDWKLKAR